MSTPLFSIGDRVSLRSSTKTQGRVVEQPRPYKSSFEYLVLINNYESWYAEEDLVEIEPFKPTWKKRDAFLCDMLLLKLTQPFSDSLYAYRASRTEFAAYQFRPVLKFLNNPDQRILIADEVGLGKTIEACIIYLEMKARLNISKVLIVCPSRLRQKWQDELRNRFDEDFKQLDSAGLHRLFDDYDRTQGTIHFRAIVGYETLRREEFIARMITSRLKVDMIIIDEAHYMRNSDTSTHRAGAIITDNADAVVFLTATPLHLGNQDLYNLLHLLSPGEYYDSRMFAELIRPNTHINQAARLLAAGESRKALNELTQVEKSQFRRRFEGNPVYSSVKNRLESKELDRQERVSLQRDLLELNTLSSIFTRTRKREVASAAVRAAYSIVVKLTTDEQLFYDTVLQYVREELRRTNFGAISFAIVIKERIAASCLGALKEKYDQMYRPSRTRVAAGIHYESAYYDTIDPDDSSEHTNGTAELTYDEHLGLLAQRIGSTDSKFDKFLEILEDILLEPETKILIFSTFRDTLGYLERKLFERGHNPSVIHGDVKIADRQSVIENFRVSPDTRMLLSSEVGAEGLDFQFCGVLINYDLPWNPMQVEQRIGRLDRFGQLHDRIRIYNFYIEGTIETRILRRLYDRIGIFSETVGDLEAILGEEIRQLSRKVLQSNLTETEEERLADEVASQIIRRRIDEEKLESRRDEFLGQDVILNQHVESTIGSGRVIHPDEVRAAVQLFLRAQFDRAEFTRDHEEPTWTLTIHPELTAALRKHQSDNRDKALTFSERFQEAMVFNKQIALTFDNEFARKRPLLEFITYNHVLADLAVSYWRAKQRGIPALSGVQVYGPKNEIGEGYFFIYALDERGSRTRRTLMSVVVMDDGSIAEHVSSNILGQIQANDQKIRLERPDERYTSAQEIADSWIADKRYQRRLTLEKQNEALISARSAAVEQSFQAKITRSQETRDKVSDARIKRLYEGQIQNLKAELDNKIEEIQKGRELSVSYSLLAIGRVQVTADEENGNIPVETNPFESLSSQMDNMRHDEQNISKKTSESSKPSVPSVLSWLVSKLKRK